MTAGAPKALTLSRNGRTFSEAPSKRPAYVRVQGAIASDPTRGEEHRGRDYEGIDKAQDREERTQLARA